jgi:hypothetical protein
LAAAESALIVALPAPNARRAAIPAEAPCDRVTDQLIEALTAYRQANGRLPATLERLVPAHLQALPVSPETGRPLEYVPSGEGFRISCDVSH